MATRKPTQIKAFCNELHSIVCIKRLGERQHKAVFNKLVNFVKKVKSEDFYFEQYIKLVVENTLTDKEKRILAERLAGIDSLNEKDEGFPTLGLRVIAAYYQTIIEYYPEFRIEYICYEVNQLIPESILLDSLLKDSITGDDEFKKRLEEKVSKGKTVPAPTSGITTLDDIKDIEKFLKSNIVGQDHAIMSVCNALKLKAAEFTKHINLFFIGKTGRGKTQLARKLGEKYSENFWIINCAEFSNGHEVSKLLGSPPGYIGHSESSIMKEKADKSSKWTIVFDEIEKAHPKFFNILLSLMDTGTVTDNSGNEIDFSDSIFIMTSNCGLRDLKTNLVGFGGLPSSEGHRLEIMKSLENTFSPEFRGRVDEFIFFNDLNGDHVKEIAKLTLSKYPIKATPEIISYVIKHGYSEEYGARDIQRTVRTLIALPLADEILSNRLPDNGSGKYDAHVCGDKIEIINTIALSS
jgi:ATP-dependent Clp protease ATP-binding subunit ClpA